MLRARGGGCLARRAASGVHAHRRLGWRRGRGRRRDAALRCERVPPV